MARQNFIGMVISQGKMQKTVKVRVETKIFNKRINKELIHRKDYLVHDEADISREGDLVRIETTRPLSKRKFFAIAEILKNKGQQFAKFEKEAKINVAREEASKSEIFLERRKQIENENLSLLEDIRRIQNCLNKSGSQEELKEIKEKYGITDFSKDTVKELLKLNVSSIQEDLIKERSAIDSIQTKLQELVTNDTLANQFLTEKGVEEPEELKKNIKKNILRKYLLQDQTHKQSQPQL
ncbi:similar to Saccharomyces cerevisiae YMR188C MRPS17 Mitochondrial ribosomal protein of the small subunit [Maudiozyma saulgeensis]|uniref:Similar to Saccharomyces cerevisiae YMR188C MRPS17 Mitochondrial ribosomal protein of the small subunit n=1 Tax=Maudiozyma saulgeensis TaxID=1789683 RepID=A0A1X7R070_9SACH|nr:similar to Saccharomyces cerevisiae YMR188C MRPS17 Mitochondrial ribosomal protein of the small subunit [Kazachstania saulgeensis]